MGNVFRFFLPGTRVPVAEFAHPVHAAGSTVAGGGQCCGGCTGTVLSWLQSRACRVYVVAHHRNTVTTLVTIIQSSHDNVLQYASVPRAPPPPPPLLVVVLVVLMERSDACVTQ